MCEIDIDIFSDASTLTPLNRAIDFLSATPLSGQCNDRVAALSVSDMGKYCEHLKRLDKHDLYMRFSCHVTHDQIDRHVTRISAAGTSVVGLFINNIVRGAVEIHYSRAGNKQIELAFSVEKAFQGRGFGTMLMEAAISTTRDIGMIVAEVICLPQNEKMQRLAGRYAESFCECDDDVVITIDIMKVCAMGRNSSQITSSRVQNSFI